jgi:hypothetical protein
MKLEEVESIRGDLLVQQGIVGSTNRPTRPTPLGTRAPSARMVSVEMWRGEGG